MQSTTNTMKVLLTVLSVVALGVFGSACTKRDTPVETRRMDDTATTTGRSIEQRARDTGQTVAAAERHQFVQDTERRIERLEARIEELGDDARDTTEALVKDAKSNLQRAKERLAEAKDRADEEADDAAQRMKRFTKDVWNQTKEGVENMIDAAGRSLDRAEQQATASRRR